MEAAPNSHSIVSGCQYMNAVFSNDRTVGYNETSDEFVSTDEEEFSCEDTEDVQDHTVEKLSLFVNKVTRDLCRFIQFNATGEDHCDVYEDKFATTTSGRDLYYADLLAMARYGDNADSSQTVNKKQDKRIECKWPCSGRRNPKLGLGPLAELFDHLNRMPNVLRHTGIPEQPQCPDIHSFHERNFSMADSNYWYPDYNSANQLDLSEILEKWPLESSHQGESLAFHNNFIAG